MFRRKERRKASRIKRRAAIQFETGGKIGRGIILNLSESGMFVQSEHLLPAGTVVRIPIRINPDTTIELRGRIAWSRAPAAGERRDQVGGMGIELSATPQEYIRFVHDMRQRLVGAPRGNEERFEVYHRVRFQSGQAFLTEFTENLSRGGMYLATDQPLEPGTVIHAQLEIPGMDAPIQVDGRVAYRLDGQAAEERGRPAGMGIQFVDLTPEARAKLNHYIRRLEIHRTHPERRLSGEIPEKGSLSDYLVPEILLALQTQAATGILLLKHQEATKLVYFKKGYPIFVESNLRTETLGMFLVREGILTEGQLDQSLRELAKSDLHHGEVLVDQGLIDPDTLVTALVEHQEEKVINTFQWFEGAFEFAATTDWPPTISILPLRTYNIVFNGITRWYDAALISAWMGLHEESALTRVTLPAADTGLPALALDLLRSLDRPKTIRKLSERHKIPLEELLPSAFALIICGWAELDFTHEADVSEPQFKAPKTPSTVLSDELLSVVRRWIDEDFEHLRGQDFYELFSLEREATETELTRAYLDRSSRYRAKDVENINDPKVRQKISHILSWMRVAYDSLRDPQLRQIYSQRKKAQPRGARRQDRIEVDRLLFTCIRDLESGHVEKAVSGLTLASQMFPNDPTVSGYLGWALFQSDQQKNIERATELLEHAMQRDPSDAHLCYYRGQICAYLSDWRRAEGFFSQALRLYPHFVSASAAIELARERREAQDRVSARA